MWERPSLDNLEFAGIGDEKAQWIERKFEEEEIRQAVFSCAGDKAPQPNGFPMAFFQRFWDLLKVDILEFLGEFHAKGKLTEGMGASFITLIPKKEGDIGIKDFRPISLIGSVYKILSKVLAVGLQKILIGII